LNGKYPFRIEAGTMFGFREKVPYSLLPSNPGRGVAGKVGFARGESTWSDQYDLVAQAADALEKYGHQVSKQQSWLRHQKSGFVLLPQFVELQPLDAGGVRTTTTMQAHHPVLVPDGVFEYQHSTGKNLEDSIRSGFDQWLKQILSLYWRLCSQIPRAVLRYVWSSQRRKES
jgi:hypothetical protein